MIKRITMLARRDDLSVADFADYWYGQHADIVRGMPGLHRYLQNHILRVLTAGNGAEAFRVDGMPELWFLDEDAKNVAFASPAAKALPEDEKNFLKGITIFGVEESVVLAGQGDVKVLVLRRSDDVPVPAEDALGWCRDLLQAVPAARACILNRVLTSEHRPGVWHEQDPPDLIVEFRFESAEVAAEAIGRESFQTFLGAQPDGMTVAAYLIEVRTII
ncbi:MAG: EthD family reductase [Bauldia sp.]|nr:EthD family reductase [Bauldia sp.]